MYVIIISNFFFVICMAIIKHLTNKLSEGDEIVMDPMDLVLLRSGFLTIMCFMIICLRGQMNELKYAAFNHPNQKFMYLRCVAGVICYMALNYNIMFLPLFITVIIFNTSPFWVVFQGYLVFGDKLKPFDLMCMIGSFSGIICLSLSGNTEGQSDGLSYSTMAIGVFFATLTAQGYGLVIVASRRLQNISPYVVNFLYGVLCVAGAVVAIAIQNGLKEEGSKFTFFQYTSWQYGLTLVMSIMNVVVQNMNQLAFSYGKGTTVALLIQSQVVYTLLMDICYFHTSVNAGQIVGASIVVAFSFSNVVVKMIEDRKKIVNDAYEEMQADDEKPRKFSNATADEESEKEERDV